MFNFKLSVYTLFLTVFFAAAVSSGCAVEAAKADSDAPPNASGNAAIGSEIPFKAAEKKSKIDIKPNSPAETVQAFVKNLREKHFREAIFLTNLRPAIEGLTDAELKDFQVDFESLSQIVSSEITINGEVISGDNASVMAKIPDAATGNIEIQTFRLKKQNDYWTILTVDEATEKVVQKEGKNYLFNLRLETHQTEAKKTLDRISQAEMVFALQNQQVYADLTTLVDKNLLPAEMLSADNGGYNFALTLAPDRKSYTASAAPAKYGKTGKLSYLFETDEKNLAKITEKDVGGKFLVK